MSDEAVENGDDLSQGSLFEYDQFLLSCDWPNTEVFLATSGQGLRTDSLCNQNIWGMGYVWFLYFPSVGQLFDYLQTESTGHIDPVALFKVHKTALYCRWDSLIGKLGPKHLLWVLVRVDFIN